jgi:hypothetical protein
MQAASKLIVVTGIAAIGILYVLGLINKRRGGSPDLSQKLLRWQLRLLWAVILFMVCVKWSRG